MNQQRGEVNLHLVLTIFLGFGMVLFGILAVVAYRDSTVTQANLHKTVAAAKEDAAANQKAQDVIANTKANELPYRTYKADEAYGGFELQVPKSWSLVVQKGTGATPLDILSDPDTVMMSASSAADVHAFELQLLDKSVASVNATFESRIKQKKTTSKAVTVSGIPATWYEGMMNDQKQQGVVITLPVRDKVMLLINKNPSYINEFNQMVQAAKINP